MLPFAEVHLTTLSHCTALHCSVALSAMQLDSLCRQPPAIIYSSDFKQTLPLSPEPRGRGGREGEGGGAGACK